MSLLPALISQSKTNDGLFSHRKNNAAFAAIANMDVESSRETGWKELSISELKS